MTFKKKYEPEDFLSVLSTDKPQTTTNIAKKTGAGRSTAIRFLQVLEKAGKAKIVEIEGEGGYHAWVRVEPIKKDDKARFIDHVEKYLAEYSDSEIAKKVLDSLKE
jgi:DNA-binding IclR family transcriptional regulator